MFLNNTSNNMPLVVTVKSQQKTFIWKVKWFYDLYTGIWMFTYLTAHIYYEYKFNAFTQLT